MSCVNFVHYRPKFVPSLCNMRNLELLGRDKATEGLKFTTSATGGLSLVSSQPMNHSTQLVNEL